MDRQYYDKQFALEDSHWWYLGRRAILRRLLTRFRGASSARALEIGCGGGCNLATLQQFAGQVSAVEMDAEGVAQATRRQIGEVVQGRLGDAVPTLQRQYDLVGMFDVLEHIPDDADAVRHVRELLAPGGRLFLTVPAYMLLWTAHDEIAHHQRRYTRGGLNALLRANGFRIVHASYFNTLLFPLAVVERILTRLLKLDPKRTFARPPQPINRLLTWIFSLESGWVARWPLPFGLSIAVVAEREMAADTERAPEASALSA